MKELEQNAFLLHSRPFRDNQVIAEFLTELNGKKYSELGRSIERIIEEKESFCISWHCSHWQTACRIFYVGA